jgi:putative hydrolase of the HAD superfamily
LIASPDAVRLILLDAVGTVLHPRQSVAQTYHDAGRARGSGRTLEEVRVRFREAWDRYAGRAVWPRIDGRVGCHSRLVRANTSESRERRRWRRIVGYVLDDVPDQIEPLFEELWKYFACPDHWHVQDGLGDFRQSLESRGYRIGLASNFDRRLVELCNGIPSLRQLPYLFCSSQLGVSKPDLRFYQRVEQLTGMAGEAILMVGDDRLHDVEAPRRLGWQTLHWNVGPEMDESAVRDLDVIERQLVAAR